jgi:ATP-binding cassette subfamily B protein
MKEKAVRDAKKTVTVLSSLAGGRRLFAAALLAAFAGAAASLAAPAIMGRAIDSMLPGGGVQSTLLSLVVILGAVYLAASLFQYFLSLATNRVSYLTAKSLRERLFGKLDRLPVAFFDGHAHGDVVSRFVNDVDAVSDGLLQGLAQLLSGIATILGAGFFMFASSPVMAAVVVVLSPLSIFSARFIAKHSKRRFKDQAAIVGAMNGYAEELVEGRREMKAFRMEAAARERYGAMNAELYEAGVKAQFISALANPSARIVNNVAYAVVGVAGCLIAMEGGLTVGGVSSFLLYATLFAKPFSDITNVLSQIQGAMASAKRIEAILALREEEEAQVPAAPLPPDAAAKGKLRFEGVGFSYDKSRPLIEGFSLDIPYGTSVAIVGRTGAGKTTLVNLLMRFYDVDSGRISLDGRDIRDFDRDEYRRLFGMVLQDTWLFEGSVADNIAYGKPGASREEIRLAAEKAGAAEFIARLPRGYDSPVSDSGGWLSQGQRQLLTIARVMLADPPFFILDEATSSIDTRTELRVQEALKALSAGRTSFTIAHRLSTIRGADLILVLEAGRVVETGRHEELCARGGAYSRLYGARSESFSVF